MLTNREKIRAMNAVWPGGVVVLVQCVFGLAATQRLEAKGQNTVRTTSVVRYSGGGKVQLIGVAVSPAEGQSWWSASGAALPHAPARADFRPHLLENNQSIAREFVFVRTGLPMDAAVVIDVLGSQSSDDWIPVMRHKASAMRVAATFPLGSRTASIRIGIAKKAWTSIGNLSPSSRVGLRMSRQPWGATSITLGIFSATMLHGRPRFTVINSDLGMNYQTRFAAVDRQGHIHAANILYAELTGSEVVQTINFKDINLADIQKIVFQIRPYEWREFHDIPLEPK
ncbi:MAG: Methicillin resistance mecR1 protein [Capsulimonas sp.]|nr:Methicillin resistance mecR1 protein [Capsulimonas sp.]